MRAWLGFEQKLAAAGHGPDQHARAVFDIDGALDQQCNQSSECATEAPLVQANKAVLNAEYQGDSSFCTSDMAARINGAPVQTSTSTERATNPAPDGGDTVLALPDDGARKVSWTLCYHLIHKTHRSRNATPRQYRPTRSLRTPNPATVWEEQSRLVRTAARCGSTA
jgi:hypothetical protein